MTLLSALLSSMHSKPEAAGDASGCAAQRMLGCISTQGSCMTDVAWAACTLALLVRCALGGVHLRHGGLYKGHVQHDTLVTGSMAPLGPGDQGALSQSP